jgi:cell division protein FtsI (penicillin-binding protein 3)
VDGKGISGIEYQYDEVLSGKDGEMIMETGLGGIPIAGAAAQVTEPEDGQDLVLSIDVDVQKLMEEEIESAVEENKATTGIAMATDPRTGEIIAACSTPYADLTNPLAITNEALNLKMVSHSYDPGSTFKVLTAAIGLESGTVEANDYFTVPPYVTVGKDFVTDSDDRWDYTPMNLREVLRRSSNVGAALIAQEAIGADAFSEGVAAFGIGQLTGIDYPGEVPGMVKSRSEYDPSSLGSMAFGQGITFPMVQMVRAVGSIANGGLLKTPHFVTSVGGKQLSWPEGERSVSEGTAEKIADMMCTVVEEGTGTSAAVEGYDVAAKTGTGEQAENGTYLKGKYLASLIGFAPARDPEVLVYVGLNETPYLSYSSAGPAFSAIMGEVLADMGILSTSWGL